MPSPLPKSLKGGAAHNVLSALIEKGFLKEVKANRRFGDPVWRESNEGHGLTLIICDAGFSAIGIDVEPQKTKAQKPEPKPRTEETKTK